MVKHSVGVEVWRVLNTVTRVSLENILVYPGNLSTVYKTELMNLVFAEANVKCCWTKQERSDKSKTALPVYIFSSHAGSSFLYFFLLVLSFI